MKNLKTIKKMLIASGIKFKKDASALDLKNLFIENRKKLEEDFSKKTLLKALTALNEEVKKEAEEVDDEYESLWKNKEIDEEDEEDEEDDEKSFKSKLKNKKPSIKEEDDDIYIFEDIPSKKIIDKNPKQKQTSDDDDDDDEPFNKTSKL